MSQNFRAPWDNIVKAVTLGVLLLFGIIISFTPTFISIFIGVVICAGSALFMVRSYTINGQKLIIHRLGWTTEFDLNRLKEVIINRDAMSGSWRMFGIGGFFGYIGSYRNDELGNFRAYATHRYNCVVMQFENQTIVVTPGAPQSFAETIQAAIREKNNC